MIKERHEILVPCGLSPTGEHRVWIDCDAERRIVRLVSECRHEGDAALRLGAETCCRRVVLAVRHRVAVGRADRADEFVDVVPAGVESNVWNASYEAERKRKERAPHAPDTRPLLVRLLQRRARKLSPEFAKAPLRASREGDGTLNLHASPIWHGGSVGQVVAQKRRGLWRVEERGLVAVAKYLGESNHRCLVCNDDRSYEDFQAHGRARAHQGGVAAILRRVLEALP
jgi:hypothetical protein